MAGGTELQDRGTRAQAWLGGQSCRTEGHGHRHGQGGTELQDRGTRAQAWLGGQSCRTEGQGHRHGWGGQPASQLSPSLLAAPKEERDSPHEEARGALGVTPRPDRAFLLFLPTASPPGLLLPWPGCPRWPRHPGIAPGCASRVPRAPGPAPGPSLSLSHGPGPGQRRWHPAGPAGCRPRPLPVRRPQIPPGRPGLGALPPEGLPEPGQPGLAAGPVPGRAPRQGAAAGRAGAAAAAGQQDGQQLLPSQNGRASGEPSLPRELRAGRGQAAPGSEGLCKGADLPLGDPHRAGESGVTPTQTLLPETAVFAMHGPAHVGAILQHQGHPDHHSSG